MNQFIDMTNLEFRMVKNSYSFSQKATADYTHTIMLEEELPAHVDWRTKNVVTPVKDQGQVGRG